MSLAALLAVAFGILVEILLLWESADRQAHPAAATKVTAQRMSRLQQGVVLVLLLAWLVIGLADRFASPLSVQAQSAVQQLILFFFFSFLFVFGLVLSHLLPRVNEQTVFIVSLLAFYAFWSQGALTGLWLLLAFLPLTFVFWMAWTPRPLSTTRKSLLYGWYLLSLLGVALQNDFTVFFQQSGSNLDYFVGGMTGTFLLLHSVFLVRFGLMLTALLLPANRHLIARAMPRLFDDRQMPRAQVLMVLAVFGGVLALNRLTGLLPSLALLNLLIWGAVHFWERPVLPFLHG